MSQIIYPYSATFDANGTAEVGQAQQMALNKMLADHDLSFTDSSIFDAFTVAEGTPDASGDYNVTYSGGASALKAALEGAKSNVADGDETLQQILQRLLKDEVGNDLVTLGLHNIVEAEELMNVVVPNDALGNAGSAAMHDVLSTNDVNIVAAQVPYSKFAANAGAGGSLNTILTSGDSIVFYFTVNSKLEVTPVLQQVATAPGATPTGSAEPKFDSTGKSRTVNLTIIKA